MRRSTLLCAMALLAAVSIAFPATESRAADKAVVDMIVELLGGDDKDMRALALEQVREKVPGTDATMRFVTVLPTLPTDVQVRLIDALGDRGDVAARPAIVKMLGSKTEALRAAAATALAGVAGTADVPVLAKIAATGSDAEKDAARGSLRKLRGHAMNAAMTEALKTAGAKPKIELIAALVDRNVPDAVPVMARSADDPDLAVRMAVLAALRAMADENQTAVVVRRLKSAKDKAERKLAALTLLATCKRGQAQCADPVIAGLAGAEPTTRILLMRALPLAGGPKALGEIVARMADDDKDVSVEALRQLANWPDPAAIGHLKELARDVKNLRNHVLAIRGMARLAGPGKDRPADLATLSEAMTLASRKQEKVLVLGTLGTVPTLESLALAATVLDQPEIAEDACFAAVLIAEKISGTDKARVRAVMQKVVQNARSEETRARAKKVLQATQP